MNDLTFPTQRDPLDRLFDEVKHIPSGAAADIIKKSRMLGMPTQEVAQNYEGLNDAIISHRDYAVMAARSPRTAEWLKSDPYYAAAMREKLTRLEEIEGSWKPWRQLKEETKSVARGIIGGVIGNVEAFMNSPQTPDAYISTEIGNVARLQPQNFGGMPSVGAPYPQPTKRAETLRSVINSDLLRPGMPVTSDFGGKVNETLLGNRTWGDLGYGVIGMIPQIVGQVAAFALGGPAGSFSFNAAMIGGGQYLDLIEDGADPQRAFVASMGNALTQAFFEQISINRAFKALPKGTPAANRFKERVEAGMTEGMTEWAQKFPEAAAELWVKHPGKGVTEVANLMADDIVRIMQEGLFEGLVAAPFGVLGRSVSLKMQEKSTEWYIKNIERVQQQLAKSEVVAVSPEAAVAHLEAVTQNERAYLEPEALLTLYQSSELLSQDEIDSLLGISREKVELAASTGELVELSLSQYMVAVAQKPEMAMLNDHLSATPDGMTMKYVKELNELDVKKAVQEEKRTREERMVDDGKLKSAQKELYDEAVSAGMKSDEAGNLVAMFTANSRIYAAAKGQSHAQWFRENRPVIRKGREMVAGAMGQSAMYRNPARNITEFREFVEENKADPSQKNKSFFRHKSDSGAEIDFSFSDMLHIEKRHPLTNEQLQSIVDNIESIDKAFLETKQKGDYGVPVLLVLNTQNGKAGAVLDFAPNGRIFFKTGFFDSAANIENWVKEKSPIALGPDTQNAPGVPINQHPYGNSSITNIQQKLGIVNNRLFQSPLGFYSAVARAIKSMDFKTMPAKDLLSRIVKTPGVKQEELSELGLIDWLKGQDGKVTKDQVLAFVEQGGVEIKEIVKGAGGEARLAYDQDQEDGSWRVYTVDTEEIIHAFEEQAFARDFVERENLRRGNTKYGQYQLPGGENYREVLLTLPTRSTKAIQAEEIIDAASRDWEEGEAAQEKYGMTYKEALEIAERANGIHATFRSNHWEEQNVLAHFRLNDRIVDGQRVLFIEEIQSDWHQAGREKGYGGFSGKPPDAPFKATPSWAMLAFKRVLRMAVEQGYDSVAWTPGEVQASRYDLSKKLDAVQWIPETNEIFIKVKGESSFEAAPIASDATEANLADYIGKDLAKKLVEAKATEQYSEFTEETYSAKTIEGAGLSIGGEGMKGFYDRILPAEVGKYIKKIDSSAKVETTTIGVDKYPDVESVEFELAARRGEALDTDPQHVWSVPITDKIRETVMQGQALYQSAKGSIHWEDGKAIISLFKTADASTGIHELLGHYMTQNLLDWGSQDDAPDWMKQDRKTMLEWAGIEDWDGATKEQKVEAHEKWARAAEAYVMEGKAPSLELRDVFRRFADWMRQVYRAMRDMGVEIGPGMRGVFDRMLASEEEITHASAVSEFMNENADLYVGLTDRQKESLAKQHDQIMERGKEVLLKELIGDINAERKQAMAAERERIEAEVRHEVSNQPFYRMVRELRKPAIRNPVNELTKEWQKKVDDMARYLRDHHGDGVENVKVYDGDIRDEQAKPEAYFRVSHNVKWYQDLYAGLGKTPTLGDYKMLAEDFLRRGFEDLSGYVDPDVEFLEIEQQLEELQKTPQAIPMVQKINTAWLKENYPEELNTFAFMHSNLGQYDLEDLASFYRFSSADEIIWRMKNTPPLSKAIKDAVDARMNEAFPVLTNAEIAEKAEAAMHNDESVALLAVQLDLIREKAGQMRTAEESRKQALQDRELARVSAQKAMEKMPLERAMNLPVWIAAARRAAIKADKAIAEGNWVAAFEQKNIQLHNNAMIQESLNARREFDRVSRYLKRQQGSGKETWITDEAGPDGMVAKSDRHFAAAGEIMKRYGFGRRDAVEPKEPLPEYVRKMEEENPEMVSIADWIAHDVKGAPLRSLTIGKLRDVESALRNIKKMARAGKNADGFVALNSDGLIMTVNNLVDAAEANAKDRQVDMPDKVAPSKKAEFMAGLRKPSKWLLELDGFKDFGAWAKAFYHALADATDFKSFLVNLALQKLEAAYQRAGIDKAQRYRDAHTKIYVPEWETSMSKNWMMAVLLNMGSESNMQRLFSRHPVGVSVNTAWNQETVTTVLTRELGANYFRLAQDIWDAIDVYDEYAAMVKKVTGATLQKVNPSPISFTMPSGETIHLRGGYYHLKADPRSSRQADLNAAKEVTDTPWMAPYPNTGASKARAVSASYAVDLDLTNIHQAIQSQAHDIAFRPVVIDINKLMQSESVKEVFRRKLGDAAYKTFDKWLRVIESGKNAVESQGYMAPYANFFRQRAVVANLLFRVGTVFQNFANPALYGNAVEGFSNKDALMAYVKYGWGEYIPLALSFNAEAETIRQEVFALSAMMRDKAENPDYTMRDMFDRQDGFMMNSGSAAAREVGARLKIGRDSVVKFGSGMLAFGDQLADIPVWRYAYHKALNEGRSQREAVRFADSVIENSTGTGRAVDSSMLQMGDPMEKLLSMFMTFVNTQYNRWANEYGIYMKEKDHARLLSFIGVQYLMFGALSAVFSFKGKKDDEELLEWFTKEVLEWPLSMIPIGGSLFKLFIDWSLGFQSYSWAMSPVERNLEQTAKLAATAWQGKATTEDAMQTAAFLFGYPDQFNDWFWNAYDASVGNMDPELRDLVRRRPKRERR